MEKPTINRKNILADAIVIIDGLPGCGKTMLAPIISSFRRVEILNYAFEIEFICKLYKLNKINLDAVESLIKMFVDHKLYQTMMGRETNFRYADISSVFNSSKPLTYFKRIFSQGDLIIPDRIKKTKPILNLTTHDLFSYSLPLFKALEDRVFFIEVIRHPYYMVIQQALNMERLLNNPRDIQVNFLFNDKEIPYYAKDWEEIFLKSNNVDKAIYSICKNIEKNKKEKKLLKNYISNILTIPFESFVINPNQYLNKICEKFNIALDKKIYKALKKQNVPRKKFADGINLEIYKRCGWQPPKKELSERDEIQLRRDFCISQGATDKAMELIDKYSKSYEKKYLSNLTI